MVLSCGERGTERAEGQSSQCSARGKEALQELKKVHVLLPSSTGLLPTLPAPALVLAFLLPRLESAPLRQMGTASPPAPLTTTTTTPSPLHALCRTSPSTGPHCCQRTLQKSQHIFSMLPRAPQPSHTPLRDPFCSQASHER